MMKPVGGTVAEQNRAYDKLTRAVGESPIEALRGYDAGCHDGVTGEMSLAPVYSPEDALLENARTVGRAYAQKIKSQATVPDKARAAVVNCKIKVLHSLGAKYPVGSGSDEIGRHVDTAWATATPNQAQKDFVEGCEEGVKN
ncbi:hypothetical protein [Streptomyces sp. NBC_00105]|uniref:hypothetical protein n=1 Tax=Streptomyces sp. NBC_00105 TaxID=2903622 RepID=UPI00324643E5